MKRGSPANPPASAITIYRSASCNISNIAHPLGGAGCEICIGYASIPTSDQDRPRKSLVLHRPPRFGNKILDHFGYPLVTSLQGTAELAHLLVGGMYIPLALQYIPNLSRTFLDYLLLPQGHNSLVLQMDERKKCPYHSDPSSWNLLYK